MYSDVMNVGCNYDLVDYWFTANEERGGREALYISFVILTYMQGCE